MGVSRVSWAYLLDGDGIITPVISVLPVVEGRMWLSLARPTRGEVRPDKGSCRNRRFSPRRRKSRMGREEISDEFKLEAVTYAHAHGWKEASSKYEVFWMTLNQWRSQLVRKGKFNLPPKPKKKAAAKRKPRAKRVRD
jgi:hypothetical protein